MKGCIGLPILLKKKFDHMFPLSFLFHLGQSFSFFNFQLRTPKYGRLPQRAAFFTLCSMLYALCIFLLGEANKLIKILFQCHKRLWIVLLKIRNQISHEIEKYLRISFLVSLSLKLKDGFTK